jgi:hypothetical protein
MLLFSGWPLFYYSLVYRQLGLIDKVRDLWQIGKTQVPTVVMNDATVRCWFVNESILAEL